MNPLLAKSQKSLWDALEAFSPFQSKLKKAIEGEILSSNLLKGGK